MLRLKNISHSLLQLFFPHICAGCGSDLLHRDSCLCLKCIYNLPETGFEQHENNPVENLFTGRLPLESATAQYYFTKSSLMQHLMHQLKYKNNPELGLQLGRLMGDQLKKSGRFTTVEALVPLPLFPRREKKRGYNQATILCKGLEQTLGIPVWDNVIARPHHTETQTSKGRFERWKNIEGKFMLRDGSKISFRHLLLVDDVITTGATLESCGQELLKGEGVKLSVAALSIAMQ